MICHEFGKRLKELRKMMGISQEAFALKIGMSRSFYAEIEIGKRNLSLLTIKKIADGYDISLGELFKDL